MHPIQVKEKEEIRTNESVSAAGQIEKQETVVERNQYKKLIGWVIGIVVLIIGGKLIFGSTQAPPQ